MNIEFSKMSGNGNDFIIFDNRNGQYNSLYENKDFIIKICKRGLSVGADGVIFVENSERADFKWQFFNSDGSTAEMCGNGARCVAKYTFLERIVGKTMTFETLSGIINAEIMDNDEVKTMLTTPHSLELNKKVTVDNKEYDIHSINTGVPHGVIVCNDVSNIDVYNLGKSIRYNKDFAINGTNVNFIEVTGENSLNIRTYERGVENETLACGTGCAASAIVAIKLGLVKNPVSLLTYSKKILTVYYDNNVIYLQGEGRRVYIANLQEEAYNY